MGGKYEGDILGLSTMYKIGSKPDLVMKSDGQAGAEYKVVDDYSGVSNEKPNLVFAKSESLADEEGKKKALYFKTQLYFKTDVNMYVYNDKSSGYHSARGRLICIYGKLQYHDAQGKIHILPSMS